MDALAYLLDRVYMMTAIPMRVFWQEGTVDFRKGYPDDADPISLQKWDEIKTPLTAKMPTIVSDKEHLYYGAIAEEETKCVIVLGPVSTGKFSKEKQHRLAKSFNVSYEDFYIIEKTLTELSASLALLFFFLKGRTVNESDIIGHNSNAEIKPIATGEYVRYLIQNAEAEIERIAYSDEIRYIHNVVNGKFSENTPMLRKLKPERVGNIAINPLKKMEYMICTSIVLVSRAAIGEGVDAMLAYSTSDLFMQRLERCRDENDMYKVNSDMQKEFAGLVKKSREIRSKSTYVEKCKVYVSTNLTKPFSLDDIAAKVGVNKSYLSRKFTEEMDMGIKQYSMMKRIEAAADVIKYSDVELVNISEALCFSSQSHFGKMFKRFMGVTPQNYRNKERLIDLPNV